MKTFSQFFHERAEQAPLSRDQRQDMFPTEGELWTDWFIKFTDAYAAELILRGVEKDDGWAESRAFAHINGMPESEKDKLTKIFKAGVTPADAVKHMMPK